MQPAIPTHYPGGRKKPGILPPEGDQLHQAAQAVRTDNRAQSQRLRERGLDVAPKDVVKHRRLQYTNPPEYALQQKYLRSVESGMVSPLSGYDNYKALYTRINREVIGADTLNGVRITGQSDHFIERVIGTMSDPTHGGRPRSGVEIDAIIDALKNGIARPVRMTKDRSTWALSPSQTVVGKNSDVSVTPVTGILIQCNPA